MNTGKVISILIFLFLTASTSLFSQIDKEFWFVGPEASANHGDIPLYIRISTMDEAANITLRMPANNKFVPVKSLIAPNTTFSIRMDLINGDPTWLDSIENRPPDVKLNKGLLLTSDKYVTSYYEINNSSNPAIFPLKGKNGLGLEFFIPGQTDYSNQVNDGSEAFDIVASRDSTTITITPAIDIVGHVANVPFQIMLNKGETYSARTLITTASASLAGSHVVADKPVAITISDDSIITGGWDIIGDQIVPVNILGWEYIAIKGFANNVPPNNNDERVYIMAVQDGTDVMIDGNPVPVATLLAGEQYNYPIPNTTNTAYVKATKPIYVYHLTGHSGEAGASILPQDSCTGSRKVGFNRSSASAFAMMILTRSGNEGSFQLNGNNSIIIASDFNPVPGTSGSWVYYRQNNMSTGQVPLDANLLENSNGKFHLGILNNVGASSEYGYYSDFSTLNLGVDVGMCQNDSIVLDGGPFRTSYEWKKLIAGAWTTVGSSQTYTCYDTGFYSCVTNGDFCTLMDSIRVDYYPNATVSLGADQTICEGTTATLTPGNYQSFEWSNGTSAPSLTTGQEGEVWVSVTNNNGCVARDTVMISIDSLPLANQVISGPNVVCQGASGINYTIAQLKYAGTYQWSLPPGSSGSSTSNAIGVGFSTIATSGNITVKGLNGCGEGPEVSLPILVDPLPGQAGTISLPASVCQGQTGIPVSVPAISAATAYQWVFPTGITITGGANQDVIVSAGVNAISGTVTVEGMNNCGTGPASSTFLTVNNLPQSAGTIAGSGTVCQGQTNVTYTVPTITGADSYIWTLPSGFSITSGGGTSSITVAIDSAAISGIISVKGHDDVCGDGQSSSLPVIVNPLPQPAGTISGNVTVCQGNTGIGYAIQPLSNTTSYLWNLPTGFNLLSGSGTNQITIAYGTNAVSGVIQVQGVNTACGSGRKSTQFITVNPLPGATGNISGATTVCQGDQNNPYTIEFPDPNTISYSWTITPLNAGLVSGTGSSVNISWEPAFSGQASVSVKGVNGCGSGPISPLKAVVVNYKPVVSFSAFSDLITTKNARAIVLKGVSPIGLGGEFSGAGVEEIYPETWVFDPGNSMISGSASGTNYTITYRYTNIYNCYQEATQIVRVYNSNANQFCPGTMVDVRDGKSYRTFSSGFGSAARCWMAENLNHGNFIPANTPQRDNFVVEKYCSNDQETSCTQFGAMYQWDELMDYQIVEGGKGICPPGWHLPTEAEWQTMINAQSTGIAPPADGVGGGFLKDTVAFNGFHAKLHGLSYSNNFWAFYTGNLTGTMFWTSALYSDTHAWARGLNTKNPSVSRYAARRGDAFSVRCIRD